jgi:hypothetical protein
MSIADECMTANLRISVWTGHRLDKDASRRVAEDAGAERDAARVNKHLIPRETMKDIISTQGALRTHFYANTLPWKDNGDRLLTRKRFDTFIAEHSGLKHDFEEAVERFLTSLYPAEKERAAFRMGDMFKADDYPSVADLRRRFSVSLDIDAVSEAGDFRVKIDEGERERLRGEIADALQARIGRAMQDVWARLGDAVGHMVDRLSEPDAIFRNSMLANLQEVVDVLPDLNVTDDPDLERIRQEVQARLVGHDPATLRNDLAERARVAAAAQDIYNDIGGLMRAFGASTGDDDVG